MSPLPPNPTTTLPVLATLLRGLRFVWDGRRAFLDLSFPAILVLAVLDTILSLALRNEEVPLEAPEAGTLALAAQGAILPMLVMFAVMLFFWTTFAVAWHRLILLPKEPQDIRRMLKWAQRHWRFLGYFMGLAGMVALISVTGLLFVSGLNSAGGGGAASALWLLILFCTVLVYARFAPVLPAAAIDHGLKFGESWGLTRGQTGRLVAIFAATLIVPNIAMTGLQGMLVAVLDDAHSFMAYFVRSFAGNFLNFVGIAILVSVLSFVYDHLRPGRPPSVDLTVF